MKTYQTTVRVYFSKDVEIEVDAKNKDEAMYQVINYECNDEIDERLNGDDFILRTGYCDDFIVVSMNEKEIENETI